MKGALHDVAAVAWFTAAVLFTMDAFTDQAVNAGLLIGAALLSLHRALHHLTKGAGE